jgi:hypothetical protein
LFEVEIKTMNGRNESSTVKREVFKADDFDWSTPYRPTLDITKYINVTGDFFSQSEHDARTVTTFRMFADYETLVQGVYDSTRAYFYSFMNDAQRYKVDVETCSEYGTYQNEPNVFSDAQRKAAAEAFEQEKQQKILDFSTGFTVFDQEYFQKVKEYEEQLDAEQAA